MWWRAEDSANRFKLASDQARQAEMQARKAETAAEKAEARERDLGKRYKAKSEEAERNAASLASLNTEYLLSERRAKKELYCRVIQQASDFWFERRLFEAQSSLMSAPQSYRGIEFDMLYEALFRSYISFDHGSAISSLVVSDSSAYFATGSTRTKSIKVWDSAKRRLILKIDDAKSALGFRGTQLVYSTNSGIFAVEFLENETHELLRTKAENASLSQSGKSLFLSKGNILIAYDLESKRTVGRHKFKYGIWSLSTALHDEGVIVGTTDYALHRFTIGGKLDHIVGGAAGVERPLVGWESEDGQGLAWIDRGMTCNVLLAGPPKATISPMAFTGNHLVLENDVEAFAWSRESKQFATGHSNGSINVHRVNSEHTRADDEWHNATHLLGHQDPISAIAFANHGRDVVAADISGKITYWRDWQESVSSFPKSGTVNGPLAEFGRIVNATELGKSQFLAFTSENGNVEVVDRRTGLRPRWLKGQVFGYGDAMLASATETELLLWEEPGSTPPFLTVLPEELKGRVSGIAVDPKKICCCCDRH